MFGGEKFADQVKGFCCQAEYLIITTINIPNILAKQNN